MSKGYATIKKRHQSYRINSVTDLHTDVCTSPPDTPPKLARGIAGKQSYMSDFVADLAAHCKYVVHPQSDEALLHSSSANHTQSRLAVELTPQGETTARAIRRDGWSPTNVPQLSSGCRSDLGGESAWLRDHPAST